MSDHGLPPPPPKKKKKKKKERKEEKVHSDIAKLSVLTAVFRPDHRLQQEVLITMSYVIKMTTQLCYVRHCPTKTSAIHLFTSISCDTPHGKPALSTCGNDSTVCPKPAFSTGVNCRTLHPKLFLSSFRSGPHYYCRRNLD